VAARSIDRATAEELAATLHRQLVAIDRGEIDATSAMRDRLVGALTALRVVLGDDPSEVLDSLMES